MKDYQRKSGAILSYLVIGVTNLIGILYTPFLLKSLGQSEFGLFSLVASIITYFAILDFGLGNTIVRYTAKLRTENRMDSLSSIYGVLLFIYSSIAIVTIVSGIFLHPYVESLYEGALSQNELAKVKILLRIMMINVGLTFPLSVFTSIVMAHEKFVFLKSMQLVRIVLNTLFIVVFLEMGYKSVTMVTIMTVFNLLTLLGNLIYSFKKLKIKILFRLPDSFLLKELFSFSFYLFLGAIIDRLFWSSGQLILGATKGAIAVAIFALSIRLQQMYMSFSTSISGVFLPKITRMVSMKRSDQDVSDLFIRTGRVQFSILGFVLSGFIVFGKDFIMLWAGPEYLQSYHIALAFFIPLLIPLIQNLGITILQARNELRFRAVLYLALASVAIITRIGYIAKFLS